MPKERQENPKGLSDKAKTLLGYIPEDGSFATNQSLRYRLRPHGFSTEEYWKYRKELVEKSLIQVGTGRGGSVARTKSVEKPAGHVNKIEKSAGLVNREEELYPKLKNYLENNQVENIKQSKGQAWVAITAKGGSYSGEWTKPDVTLVQVASYRILPNVDIAITTYEIKKYRPQMSNSWVFEAASNAKGAHYPYLVVEATEERAKNDSEPTELLSNLQQFGVGFGWLFCNSESKEYEFNIVLDPERKNPTPLDEDILLENFVNQLYQEDQIHFKNAIK